MRIFRDKGFTRFARRQNIRDRDLGEAIHRAERGLMDADLGGGVIKQRIARPHEGKAGGFRTILYFRAGERAFFVYGFAKNERDNISADELRAFRHAAAVTLALDERRLQNLIEVGELMEVKYDEAENLQEPGDGSHP